MADNAVRYVQLRSLSTLFTPATRAFGNIAVIGATTSTATPLPPSTVFTDPDTANDPTKGFPGDLGTSIALAFQQNPGPTVVYGVPSTGTDLTSALTIASTLDVQLVVLANTPLTATTVTASTSTSPGGVHFQLSNHVTSISKEDGKERMAVAMLLKDSSDVTNANLLKNERMVYIAHKSTEDAAAAVAGTIAGYPPYVSLLLKPVNIQMPSLFSPAEIININRSEDFGQPPQGQNVNWLTSPALLPGGGIYMGEGYTGNNDPTVGKKFIDIVRTIDDVSFNLKARLISSIGVLRISRSGLRSLVAQMEAVLDPYVRNGILDSYDVVIPLLILLDKNPNTLTPPEIIQIQSAEAQRLVEVLVAVKYNAQIHRLAITLTFE